MNSSVKEKRKYQRMPKCLGNNDCKYEDVESNLSKSTSGTKQINWWKLSIEDTILKLYVCLGVFQHVGRVF